MSLPPRTEDPACPPGHLPYPSATLAGNAVLLHTMASPYCEAYNAWACGDHWHVGHPSRTAGRRCKRHPAHRAARARIARVTGSRRVS